jgi:large subunit ribosomal protein L11
MGKQTVEVMVEGGKATPAPPLGPSLAPLGVNIGQVVAKINEKTKDLAGMQVPVKVIVNTDRSFEIEVGSPPASALIKKELSLEKGSAEAGKFRVGDISEEQVARIARAKFGSDGEPFKNQIKGTCRSMGVTIGKGAVSQEELKAQEAEKARLKADEEAKEEAAKLREAGIEPGAAPEEGGAKEGEEGAESEPKEGGAKGEAKKEAKPESKEEKK